MNKNILLIQPPIRDFYCTHQRLEPLGLEYIASAAAEGGWEVEIIDCLQRKRAKNIPLPESMSYLRQYYRDKDLSPFCLFKRYQHFGIGFDKLKEILKDKRPGLIGISALFTPYQSEALETAKICKTVFPNVPIAMGGAFPSCEPERALASGAVDFVISGEGEAPLLSLLERIETANGDYKIPGVSYKKRAGNVITPVEATGKFHKRNTDFVPKSVLEGQKKSLTMQTSRGCPYHCRFCASKLMTPNGFRQREIMDVIGEMQSMVKNFGVTAFNFEDDNLTANKAWTLKFCEEIKAFFGARKLRLHARNGLCVRDLDKERLAALYAAGFSELDLSLALSSERMQQEAERPVGMPDFIDKVRIANDIGFGVTAYLIIGMPGQRTDRLAEALKRLSAEPVLIGPSIYYPTPGTDYFDLCMKKNYIDPNKPELWRSSCAPVETETFTRNDVMTFMQIIRMINFLKIHAGRGEIKSLANRGVSEGHGSDHYEIGSDIKKTGLWLAREILKNRTFFGLHKSGRDHLEIEEIPTSKKVFDEFFSGPLGWICPVEKNMDGR